MLRVALLGALAALAGCTVADTCADGSVLVALTLSGGSADADELVVDITLEGGAPRESSLTHAPGKATGNIVVQFPAGYPRGQRVDVDVTARVAGVVVGSGSGSVTLSSGCAALPLTVAPATLDDAGADLAAGDDLAPPPDLTTPADLAQCVPTTENCFNGADDDCDGHTDCDDPDCTTIAVCVPPVTGAFVVGTTVITASLCPQSYTGPELTIHSGLTAPANCSTGCSCGVTCQTQIGYFNNAANCPNTDDENQLAVLTNSGCASWNQWNGAYDVHMLATPTNCSVGGTPAMTSPSWASSKNACSTTLAGGGCAGGKICVPITPGPSCEIAAGSQTCDPGYNATGSWYTGFTDTRSCSCSCGATSGSCGTSVTLYTDASCSAGALTTTAAASNNFNCSTGATNYFSGKIVGTAVSCGAPIYNPQQGQLTPTGLQTLCCAP